MALENKKRMGKKDNILKAKLELEKKGFKIFFTLKNDPIFSLFDMIACGNRRGMKFVQVKTNNKPKLNPFIEFREFLGFEDFVSIEIWIWHNPRWKGRGKNKHYAEACWEKIII